MAQGAASQRFDGDNRDYPIRARAGSKQQDRRDSAGEFTVAAVGDRLAAREDEARRIYAASILDQTSVRITIQEPRSPRSVVRSHCRRPVVVMLHEERSSVAKVSTRRPVVIALPAPADIHHYTTTDKRGACV